MDIDLKGKETAESGAVLLGISVTFQMEVNVYPVKTRGDITKNLKPLQFEVMDFLADGFMEVLTTGSKYTKSGVRKTIFKMRERNAVGMVEYFWAAIHGTENSMRFADLLQTEGFSRWEELIPEFRRKFDNAWIRKASKLEP